MKMKKTFALVSSLCLAASMASPVLAVGSGWNESAQKIETVTPTENAKDVAIKITTTGNTPAEVIAVGIDKTELTFTYDGGNYTWDPETLQYSKSGNGWAATDKNVTVTSYSNVALNVTATIENEADTHGVTASVDKTDAQPLASAATQGITTNGTGTAQNVVYKVSVSGDPETGLTTQKIADLHLAITK